MSPFDLLDDSSVDTVAKLLIQLHRPFVVASYKQVNEKGVDGFCGRFEQIHVIPRKSQTSMRRCDGQRGQMSVVLQVWRWGLVLGYH